MKKIKACFFDLDDTLINYGGVASTAWKTTCEEAVQHFSLSIAPSVLVKQITMRNNEVWDDEVKSKRARKDLRASRTEVVHLALTDLAIDDEQILTFLTSKYEIYRKEAIYLFDDVHETLATLKKKHYKLALITNGSGIIQREKLKRFDLEKYFDLILIESEQPFGKPDKRVYQKALDYFNLKPFEACMIGDHYLWEVITPIELGMKGIWLNFENKPIPIDTKIKPDFIMQNIQELLAYL